jgi:hypothetical protein
VDIARAHVERIRARQLSTPSASFERVGSFVSAVLDRARRHLRSAMGGLVAAFGQLDPSTEDSVEPDDRAIRAKLLTSGRLFAYTLAVRHVTSETGVISVDRSNGTGLVGGRDAAGSAHPAGGPPTRSRWSRGTTSTGGGRRSRS